MELAVVDRLQGRPLSVGIRIGSAILVALGVLALVALGLAGWLLIDIVRSL
jgi:hypothetical protein